MNEQTLKLIEELALKLGTTSEYLFQILVKQAPINSICDIITIIILITSVICIFSFLWKRTKNDQEEIHSETYDIVIVVSWIIWMLLFAITFITTITSVNMIVAGYVNPEYWALRQILK